MKLALVAALCAAIATPLSAQTVNSGSQCAAEEAALSKAEHSQDNNSLWRNFHRGVGRPTNVSDSMKRAYVQKAQANLLACHKRVERDQEEAAQEAKVAEYNARPEVKARNEAIAHANASVNGHVNVETFTPSEWLRGMGLTTWIPLGRTDSKAFFYTYGSKDYQTFINVKTATLGAGNDYILMEFLAAQIDCRPGNGYPAALPMPTTYSYNGDGRPLMDDVTNPLGIEVPVEHGTVLAEAVIGTCDAVRKHGGTVNYQG